MNREDLIRAIAGEIDLNMPFVMVASERIANLVLEEAAKVARQGMDDDPDMARWPDGEEIADAILALTSKGTPND